MSNSSRKWWALAALSLVSLVIGLDLMVLNVALPTLAIDLRAQTSDLQWFGNAYGLVLAAALLPAGLLGDRYGRKRMLIAALALFGIASLGCAYCDSVGQLIAARAVLGLGAAGLMPLAMSMLTVLFEPEERGRALTIWVTANSIGVPLGPIIGGALLDHFWWGSVFLINVPVVAVALVAAFVLLPESRSPQRPRIDLFGVCTSSVGLVALTYGVIRAGDTGRADPLALGSMLAGVLILAAFVAWQRHLNRIPDGHPLVDVTLFRSNGFLWGSVLAMLATFTMFGVFFTMPQYFESVTGVDALGTGIRLLPIIGGLLVGSRLADPIAGRLGPGPVIATGYAILALGLLIGVGTGTAAGYGRVAVWFGIAGVGLGFALPAAMSAALGALSPDRSGVGSALIQAIRQVGGAIGVALLGTVLNASYRDQIDAAGQPTDVTAAIRRGVTAGVSTGEHLGSPTILAVVRDAFVHAMDTMLIVSAAVAVIGAVLAAVFLRRSTNRSESNAAAEPGPVRSAAEVAESEPSVVR
jgi:MFS transporter, DHA2 family, multidrug resistance protein